MSRRRNSSRRKLNGIFLLDKPGGASSNKVLQQVKRHFNADKAGHTGTLDPLATGMLPICFGEATKLSQYLIDANKGYETTLVLGVTTDSLDADGEVTSNNPLPGTLDQNTFVAACESFVGEQQQIPPMVSAIKVDGQRLYKLAREGVTVERKPRHIVIESLQVLSFDPPEAVIRVICSKGTYIRSLVDDIGRKLGCGAHVKLLRRTFVDPFEGRTMASMEDLESNPDADSLLMPMDVAITHIPSVILKSSSLLAFSQGRTISRADLQIPLASTSDQAEPTGLDHLALTGSAQTEFDDSGPGSNHADAEPPKAWVDPMEAGGGVTGSDQDEVGQMVRVYDPDGVTLLGLGSVNEAGEIAPKRVFQLD